MNSFVTRFLLVFRTSLNYLLASWGQCSHVIDEPLKWLNRRRTWILSPEKLPRVVAFHHLLAISDIINLPLGVWVSLRFRIRIH